MGAFGQLRATDKVLSVAFLPDGTKIAFRFQRDTEYIGTQAYMGIFVTPDADGVRLPIFSPAALALHIVALSTTPLVEETSLQIKIERKIQKVAPTVVIQPTC